MAMRLLPKGEAGMEAAEPLLAYVPTAFESLDASEATPDVLTKVTQTVARLAFHASPARAAELFPIFWERFCRVVPGGTAEAAEAEGATIDFPQGMRGCACVCLSDCFVVSSVWPVCDSWPPRWLF